MNIWDAVILGTVEGVTEFLPISSTGHLILAGNLLHFTGEKAATFEIFIQLGAILAVVVLYFKRFLMLLNFGDNAGFSGLRGWKLLMITSLPALVLGFLAHDFIKHVLFNPVTVSLALIVGGVAIILVERLIKTGRTDSLDRINVGQGLQVGLFQCFALWPGMSRSASTIIGGMFSGLDRRLAAEYSFLAAVPIMCAATLYDLLKELKHLNSGDLLFFAVGFVVSFITAIFAIRFFIHLLQRWTLTVFGIYRIIVGVAFLLMMHNLPAGG